MLIIMLNKLEKLKDYLLESKIKPEITSSDIKHEELTITVKSHSISKVLAYLKEGKKYVFDQLISVCGADYPSKPERFEIIYHLLSMRQNLRIRVKTTASENTFVPSITPIFACANWYEREVWDMFGVKFSNHPDLRRILTDYSFEGHPLRKDFPLTGNVEVRYNLESKKVEYEDVNLTQAFRSFDFLTPWEGADYVLPGDEKATKEEK
jgi:NADH-quinone oxidoreductase subunit C